MRFSHESNMRNSRLPHCASIFSSRNTAAAFSSSTLPENSLSATPTRKLKSCSRKMSRRQRRIARRKSPVYQPCDLISSLKNHCTPAACSAEPPSWSARRICAAISDGLFLCSATWKFLRPKTKDRPNLRRAAGSSHQLVIHPQRSRSRQSYPSYPEPDHRRPVLHFSEVMQQESAERPSDERTNADGHERETHVSPLLPRRCEPRDVFVVARRLDDFAQRQEKQREHRAPDCWPERKNQPRKRRNHGAENNGGKRTHFAREEIYRQGQTDYSQSIDHQNHFDVGARVDVTMDEPRQADVL